MSKIEDIKTLLSLLNEGETQTKSSCINDMIGEYVIVRTYSAGVWFGILDKKDGNEVIVRNARRMWRWWAAKSISLSGCAIYGIKHSESKICPPVSQVWLEAIEIIPLTDVARESIMSAPDVEAE